MATSESPCVRSVTIPRCTTERSWFVTDMAVRGNTLAVCGYDYRTYTQSFIDLFTLNDPGSSPFMTHLFPKPSDHPRWRHRRVSFLDDSRIVTVCDDLVKVYHIKADLSELSRTVNLLQYTPVKCMTVREEAIFIGWYESKEVIVFDFNLNEIKTITLEGIEGYPVDITVYGDDLFISTYSSSSSRRASSRYNMEGKLVHEYKAPGYSYPHSITVSGLVYILWDFFHVVVYSLSDSQQLMSFNVDESHTIRIVDVNRLLTVNRRAGEVREYSMTQLCTFENLKRTLCRVMSPIDCSELKRFFKITDLDMSTNGNESRDIVAGAQDDRAAHLLAILETKGFIGSDNLDGLKKAFQHLGTAHVSMLRSQLESFQLHSKHSEEHSDRQSTPGQDPHIWKSLNRFSTRGKWKVDDVAVEVSGKIIVSGHGIQDGRIFLDTVSPKTVREDTGLLTIECSAEFSYEGNADNKNCDDDGNSSDEDSSDNSSVYSMSDYSDRYHFTSIIDESRIVSCQGKTLKILNLTNNTEDPSTTLNGIASCVEVRGSDILVGYKSYSPDPLFPCIDVFDSALRKKCSIKLKSFSASIIDLSLLAGKLLVFTCRKFISDVCLFDGDSGNMLVKFSLPTRTACVARSVAVNDTYQMVAILWSDRWDEDGTNLSLHLVDSGLCLCLAEVNQACKLRFMNSEELILVSSEGQISSYKKTYFFSYNNLIDPIMESLASEEGWNILWQFFAVSEDEWTNKFADSAFVYRHEDGDEDDDDDDEYANRKEKLAKFFLAFLHEKIVSSSQRVAALLKASWELERFHAFALSTCINYYKCLSSGTGKYNDQPYQLLHYYESSVPLGETAATQRQIQSVDDVPGTSNSSPSMPVPSRSEIRSTGPSTYYPASTNNSAPKRRAPPYSGTNVEPHNKRKNTSSSELEQEDSTSGNTIQQLGICQQSNPASFQSHQQFVIPRNIQLPQHNGDWPRFNYGSTTNVSEIPRNHEPSFSSQVIQTSHLGGIFQQSNPASFQPHQQFVIPRYITPMVGNEMVARPPQLQQSIVGNSVRPFPHTQRALPPRCRIQGLQPPNYLIQHNQGTMLPHNFNITNIPQLSTGSNVGLPHPNVSFNQNIDLPVRQNAPQPRHQLRSNDPLQYAQLQPPSSRGGNPLTGVLTEAMNQVLQTSLPMTSLPMTQLEQQSPSNRQVIPSDRSDSSRQTEQLDRRLTAQVRSVHELQSGMSSDTLIGRQHLQPEPTISGEPSRSQVGGPSNDRPPREADRYVIIRESRMVVQESSVEPELTAQEDYDSSAPSAWRSGSTSGDINYYPASTNNSAPTCRAPPYAGTNVEPHNKRKPPDVLTPDVLHESLQKVFAEMTRSDSENLANFFMFPLKHVKAIINSPSHSKDLLVELENKGIIQSALTDELCENLKALNILTGGNWKPPDTMKITSSISGKGGLLQFPNTGIKLVFPPNAVTEEHNIQVKIPPSLSYGADTILSSNSSVVLQLLPNGLQLKREISLTFPHCLTFINEEKAKAKIYVSHHEEGQKPRWEERPLIPYIFHRSKCTVRLLGFCWLKVIIDDTEVEAKNLVVFAAKMILQNKQTAKVEVGYYENIPERGEPNILKLNPGLKPELCLQLKFMKEGKQPLTISFNGTDPDDTWYIKQGKAKQEISWQSIALSEERLVPFVLHRRKNMDSFCNFSVQQGNHNPIKFEIGLEVDLSTVEIFDSKVPDSILNELARKLTEEWQMLARELNISEFDLYNIKENNTGNIVNTKYLMLSHWSKMNGSGATCRVLAEALQKVNRRDLKEFVEKEVTMQGRNEPTQDS